MRIPSGKTDQNIYFVAVDATDLKTRETGLSGFTVQRSRNGAAEVAYTTPTVAEIDATNMPGVYALLVDEDTTIAAGSDSEEYCVHITHASMAPVTRTIELYRRDTTSGQTLTLATGNASANVLFWNNSAVATPTVAGVPEVDVTHWLGSAAPVAPATSAVIADAVWDEDITTHSAVDSAGEAQQAVFDLPLSPAIATAVLEKLIADHSAVSGSLAQFISAIRTSTDNIPTTGDIATAVATTAMTEAYSTDGGAVTLAQGLYELLSRDQEISISGTTMTVKKRDGATTAYTLTLNDAVTPTAITRSA